MAFACLHNTWQAGHIISHKNGGKAEIINLHPICKQCNNNMNDENWDDYIDRHTNLHHSLPWIEGNYKDCEKEIILLQRLFRMRQKFKLSPWPHPPPHPRPQAAQAAAHQLLAAARAAHRCSAWHPCQHRPRVTLHPPSSGHPPPLCDPHPPPSGRRSAYLARTPWATARWGTTRSGRGRATHRHRATACNQLIRK